MTKPAPPKKAPTRKSGTTKPRPRAPAKPRQVAAPAPVPARRHRWRSNLGLLLMVLIVGWCGGFLWFLSNAYSPSVPPAHADGIVVLTGGEDRLATAFRLLNEGRADRLLVSGVPMGISLHDMTASAHIAPEPDDQRVTLGHQALTTLGNAQETAGWAQAHAMHSLIVVTAGYHMPRALLELSREMPGMQLYPMRVQPAAIYDGTRAHIWRLMVAEYTKWLLAQMKFTRMAAVLLGTQAA
ncbi:YdcF family protein [Acidisoma cladoniae]|uniref:YdcF family protein n=1 Tax=Acidisoma cladoniae TaxID=3040935 RepID=UPI002549D00F|nr:ElyC/SanA/YdcF family protein [Acidisoma sp. PAMC 29798]